MVMSDGRLFVYSGASRSGKTIHATRQARKYKRVIVYDPEDQWSQLPGYRRVATKKQLLQIVTTVKGPLKVAFVPGGNLAESFNFWSGCVYHWGRFMGPCLGVAEELADVSTPAKAPDKWGILLRRGLKRGISIIAISQRWAEADKTAVGNASMFICFRQSSFDDVVYLSRKTRIPTAKLEGLKPLEFVTFDAANGDIKQSKLKF